MTEADDDFDKGFEAAMSDEESAVVTEPDVPKVTDDAQAPVVPEVEPERVEVIEGFTKEELKEQLALIPKLQKALDTTNGTYGARLAEMSKTIEKLQPKVDDTKTEVKAKSIALEKLKAEYPEIAELLAEDLKVSVESDDSSAKLREEFEAKLAQRDQEEKERSLKRLARAHPDFKDIAYYIVENGIVKFPDPKFGNWLADQPRDKFDLVLSSKDPDDLSEILTEYKESLKPPKRTAQLEAAILPKGTNQQGRTMTDKEIEEAAFRAAMAD